MPNKYAFLSPKWVDAARAIYSRHAQDAGSAALALRMNLVVEDVPFAEGEFAAHLDASDGLAEVDLGHLEDPDLTVTLGYEIAKAVLVDGDAQAGVQGFMTGQVRIEGDVTRLLAFQQATPSAAQLAIAEEVRAITE